MLCNSLCFCLDLLEFLDIYRNQIKMYWEIPKLINVNVINVMFYRNSWEKCHIFWVFEGFFIRKTTEIGVGGKRNVTKLCTGYST